MYDEEAVGTETLGHHEAAGILAVEERAARRQAVEYLLHPTLQRCLLAIPAVGPEEHTPSRTEDARQDGEGPGGQATRITQEDVGIVVAAELPDDLRLPVPSMPFTGMHHSDVSAEHGRVHLTDAMLRIAEDKVALELTVHQPKNGLAIMQGTTIYQTESHVSVSSTTFSARSSLSSSASEKPSMSHRRKHLMPGPKGGFASKSELNIMA